MQAIIHVESHFEGASSTGLEEGPQVDGGISWLARQISEDARSAETIERVT